MFLLEDGLIVSNFSKRFKVLFLGPDRKSFKGTDSTGGQVYHVLCRIRGRGSRGKEHHERRKL